MIKLKNFIILTIQLCTIAAQHQYEHTIAIDSKYILYWNYSSTNLTARLQLIGVSPYNTWVSFGITNNGSLEKSDVIVAFLRRGLAPAFIDGHFVDDSLVIQPDILQTWTYLGSATNNTSFYIDFTRYLLLKNIDSDGDINIVSGTPFISWAYGSPLYKSSNSNETYIDYESSTRGILAVPLISSIKRSSKLAETVTNLTNVITSTKTLPSNQYHYFFCQGFQLSVTGTVHITKYFARFATTNIRNYLFDMKMYFCPLIVATTTFPTAGECDPYKTASSSSLWRESLLKNCYVIGPIWVKGSFDAIEFPENVGLKLDYRFVALQMHFYNPNLESGITDVGSGIFLSYTSTLRENNLGILQLGQRVLDWKSLVLLPDTVSMKTSYYCYASCSNTLQNTISPNVVNIFASYPHTYNYGTSVKTVIIRNAQQYAYIGKNNYFDSNNQHMIYLNQTIRLAYQDQIITTCTYDTTGAETILLSDRDEVCFNYIFYYSALASASPANIQFSCASTPALSSWTTLLTDISNAGYLRKPTSSSLSAYISSSTANAISLIQTISPIDNYLRQKFLDYYFYTQHFQVCNNVTADQQNPLIPQSYLAETEDGSGSHKLIQNIYLLIFLSFLINIFNILTSR